MQTQGEHVHSTQEGTRLLHGFELESLLLWDNTADHCTPVPRYCQHLILNLLHFSQERQIQSPECEEKFTQSFRLVNTMKLRDGSVGAGSTANWI